MTLVFEIRNVLRKCINDSVDFFENKVELLKEINILKTKYENILNKVKIKPDFWIEVSNTQTNYFKELKQGLF